MKEVESEIDRIYERNEGSESVEEYHQRHGTKSLAILTIYSQYAATREVDRFAYRLRGKTVVEIGAGVGFLGIEMARFAKQVYSIEVDPAWAWVFTEYLYQKKPRNLTYIFGMAETVSDILRGDIAVIFTHSGIEAMEKVALKMCPEIIWGPNLSLEEHEPDAPPEVFEEARIAAEQYTVNDLTRHGLKRSSPKQS